MINLEWRGRLDHWRKTMPKLFFLPLGEVSWDGFTTLEYLTAEQAATGPFRPMPAGTEWGAKWEYGWFRGLVKVPPSAAGERLSLKVDAGIESAVWINGRTIGTESWSDREITLTRQAVGGEEFHLLLEAYAGHGPALCGGGPNPDGHVMVPEPAARQTRLGVTEFGIKNEELFQLWIDTETLAQLALAMRDQDSLRVAEIDEALKQMTLVVDLELPRAQMLETVRLGREVLRPALEARNGTTAPTMHCFGHAHIDIAWLWPLQETERKCNRTFGSQLTMMEEYAELKFLQTQPFLYSRTKENYPELYERIRAAVARGQWIPDGAAWVEMDTNLPGGESLIRQFIHGKRFFREEFGLDSRLMWLPDVFGYSAALPQIMRGCGVDYFCTQKILWIYNGGYAFPYNWFWWEGLDGSRVLSYIHADYSSETKPEAVHQRWNERHQKEAFHRGRLMPFGWGDGGGGPSRPHLEFLRRQTDLEGNPRCKIEAPVKFFQEMVDRPEDLKCLPTWSGELYYQNHRGTFTTQAKTKKGNRQCEVLLREIEWWATAAAILRQHPYPLAELDALWKQVLLNQFHDIIPGSSIRRVYEEAEAGHAMVLQTGEILSSRARAALTTQDSETITLFNSLSWERTELVELPSHFSGAITDSGQNLPIQQVDGKTTAFVAQIPACGWITLHNAAPVETSSRVTAGPGWLENEYLRITFNARAELTSIWDKAANCEMAAGCCNTFRLYKDVPNLHDAWDIDTSYKLQPVKLSGDAVIEPGESGPLWASLRSRLKLNDSEVSQEIILRAGSRRIDFRTKIDWRENHKLLKVNFPVSVRSEDALHEIQFGHVRRPTHTNTQYDAARFEVCQQKWTALTEELRGAALLNDSKYGISVEGNSLNLTLLRSPLAPDMTADRGLNEFTYAFYCWNGCSLAESNLVQAAYELNIPVLRTPGSAPTASLFQVSAKNVIIETVKLAEDNSGDIIVRLYESMRTATRCELRIGLPVATVKLTDMLENSLEVLPLERGLVALNFRPFEIKTLRLICQNYALELSRQ